MRNKVRKSSKHLLAFIILLPLLTACDAGTGRWQDWIAGLVGGSTSGVQGPATPELLPTPTLAAPVGPDDAASSDAAPTTQATSQPLATATPTIEREPTTDEASEPFTGTFVGTIYGDAESSAPLQLDLVQNGRQVEGTATVGEGLRVNAGGVCGTFAVPPMTLNANDELDQVDGRHISTTSDVEVNGFEVPVELEASLALDGETLLAKATMYPPAFCGREPTMSAELTRVDN